MTEAAIAPGLVRDLYVSLGEPVDNGAWSVRLYHKPFIDWIWGGCLIMALGGVYNSAYVRDDSSKHFLSSFYLCDDAQILSCLAHILPLQFDALIKFRQLAQLCHAASHIAEQLRCHIQHQFIDQASL